MPPQIASYVFAILIVGLFLLDRDRELRISKALFVPFIWLWSCSSRSLTEWLVILQTGRPLVGGNDIAKSYAEGTPLDRNVLITLMVLAVIILVRRGRLGALLRANLPIVLFLIYSAFSPIWSDFPDITIRRWFKALACVLLVMVVLSERDRDAAVRRLLVWEGFVLIPLSVLWIKYFPAIGRSNLIVSISQWQVSPVGVTTHKNSLGGICQVFGIAFVWHFLAAYRDRQRPHRKSHLAAHAIALAMVGWLFVQANSVTAQSCFLLATAFLIMTGITSVARRPWLVHMIVFVLLAVPFAALFLGVGGGAVQQMGRDSTLTGRTDIWAHVIALVHNPLMGTGFESFWLGDRLEAMHRYQLSLTEAHNGFVEIWACLGWIGVLLLVAIIVTGYRNIFNCFRRDPDSGRLRLAYFLTIIVSSFTEATFKTDGISWFLLLLISMAAPGDRLQESLPSADATQVMTPPPPVESAALDYGFQ